MEVTIRKIGKTKVGSHFSAKDLNSTKRKQIDDVIDMGQGNDRLPGTSRAMTDVTMVPPILMAGLRSAIYKTKRSDRHPTGATLETKILSQWGETNLWGFRPSGMNHGNGSVSVIGQLNPLE